MQSFRTCKKIVDYLMEIIHSNYEKLVDRRLVSDLTDWYFRSLIYNEMNGLGMEDEKQNFDDVRKTIAVIEFNLYLQRTALERPINTKYNGLFNFKSFHDVTNILKLLTLLYEEIGSSYRIFDTEDDIKTGNSLERPFEEFVYKFGKEITDDYKMKFPEDPGMIWDSVFDEKINSHFERLKDRADFAKTIQLLVKKFEK
jgi:hypothetical protein